MGGLRLALRTVSVACRLPSGGRPTPSGAPACTDDTVVNIPTCRWRQESQQSVLGQGSGGEAASRNKMDCDTAGHKQNWSKHLFLKVGLQKDLIDKNTSVLLVELVPTCARHRCGCGRAWTRLALVST